MRIRARCRITRRELVKGLVNKIVRHDHAGHSRHIIFRFSPVASLQAGLIAHIYVSGL
jgi:hypothetical protein